MNWLILSVVSSSALLLIFRWVRGNGANTRQVIMVNYGVACLCALLWFRPTASEFSLNWLLPSALLGMFFYGIFRATAHTAQTNGVAVAGIATKMSVVIPVSLALFFLSEEFTIIKMTGVLSGLMAVFLSTGSRFQKHTAAPYQTAIKWPVIAFIGSGIVDTCLKFFQVWFATDFVFPAFIATVFCFAFGTAFGHHLSLPGKTVSRITLWSGLLLGLANFISLVAILNALALPGLESSVVFPVNNFGVVALSTLASVALFREKVNLRMLASIALAGGSIFLLFYSL